MMGRLCPALCLLALSACDFLTEEVNTDRFPVRVEGSPDSSACQIDSQCVVAPMVLTPMVQGDGICCYAGPVEQTLAYWNYMERWREMHCEGVCWEHPHPMTLEVREGRCVDGRCQGKSNAKVIGKVER